MTAGHGTNIARHQDRSREPLTVWYDGACPLCIREIALMRKLDRRDAITFTDISTPASTCPIDRQLMLERFHASENGRMLSGAAAFAAMWRAIPLLRPIGLLARAPAVLAILEALYLQFLKVRPHIQKRLKPID
ncbi:thiol-disulfide oxidoreductase DCC family protein [Parasphingorhabdus sp.]|uniref:thiol-disulfide oxidoreductase DCC family protein n=1 Tax=Parasphingorhabdus sp. TaxID=2709688 RepID=UPI003593029B